jgi:rhodanese-related sulfurtransferase
MGSGRGFSKALILVLAAAVCAGVSNLAASRERKLPWVGNYTRALETGSPASSGSPSGTVSPASPTPAATPAGTVPGSPAIGASPRFPPHPDRASVEIGTDDGEALFREGRLFLDARRSSVYGEGHIPGARSFPVWESDIGERVKALYEEGLDQNAPIVLYCSGGDCEDSHMLAEKLYMVGFNALYVYKDGFPGWQKRGLPVTKGGKP